MARNPPLRRVRPTDVREGDLVATQIGNATVIASFLAEPGSRGNRRPEWWITYLCLRADGTPFEQTQRFTPSQMADPTVPLVQRFDASEDP